MTSYEEAMRMLFCSLIALGVLIGMAVCGVAWWFFR